MNKKTNEKTGYQMGYKNRVSVYVTKETQRELKARSAEKGIPMAYYLDDIISKFFEKNKRKNP